MALVAHPNRDNVWVKPELIKPEWITQDWIRPENGFEFLSNEPAWRGLIGGQDVSIVSATGSGQVSVAIDIRPARVQT